MKSLTGINLLPKKSRLQLRQMRIIKQASLAAGVILGAAFLLAIAVLGLDFYSRRRGKRNQQGLEAAKAEYIQFSDRINELQELRFRTKLVAQTLEKRLLFGPGLTRAEELLEDNAVLASLSVEAGKFEISGTLLGVSQLEKLEEKIMTTDFKNVVLENLGVDQDGKVTFSLEVQFKDL